ncbi:MAG: hypothetical protein GAK28_00369 [Luteibacter sp.]|uniref:phage tail protein n=1 Tax=Luteibacter sp. TaxID=1886636 RepID=UPI0013803977|nr:tail fiber protein [Luteibacter sp.]KAF1009725.1 MAG: hypothetical protein GAK28_00369 [Luteibacter sp.]
MADPYIGEIRLFGFNFAPQGWLLCNGALLQVRQYAALYSLLGVNYGGDGVNTFGIPDFRGRVPVNQGTAPGLTPRTIGQSFGTEGVTLATQQIPSHTHQFTVYQQATTAKRHAQPQAGYGMGTSTKDGSFFTNPQPVDSQLSLTTIGMYGGGLAHENRQPYLALNFCICVQGDFPPFD